MDTLKSYKLPAIVHQLVWAGIALALFLGALWILHRELAGVHFADVLARFRAVPWDATVGRTRFYLCQLCRADRL